MTKSTITDERITSVIERLEHFASNLKWTDVRGAQDLLTAADGLRELQERRKADSEPVASNYRKLFTCTGCGAEGLDEPLETNCHCCVDGAHWVESRLYRHAQPAPVVPTAYIRDERGAMMLNGKSEPRIGFGEGWNACRAAMLQAGNSPAQSDCRPAQNHVSPEQNSVALAQGPIDHGYRPGCECSGCKTTVRICAELAGNSPVIPDTWIPVSERMPDDSSDVLCTAEFDGPGDWRKKVGYWHEGKWVVYGASWTPTHWMPLPAVPQEVGDA